MSKADAQCDVLVLGSHPCAHLAAAVLRQNAALHITHGLIPGEETDDRLVILNPALFDLHALLGPLKRKLDLSPLYGLRFLADDAATQSEFHSKSIAAYIGATKPIRSAMQKLAAESGARMIENGALQIHNVDEQGIAVSLDGWAIKPRLLIVAGPLPADMRKTLGIAQAWEDGVLHRYSYIKCKGTRGIESGPKPLLPMSLDLDGQLNWAWLLPGVGHVQIAIEQPLQQARAIAADVMMRRWLDVLASHDIVDAAPAPDIRSMKSIDVPFAGALSQEGVANRTLLIGPAGGFYTACAEDIYPACWSAVVASDTAKKALKEPHLQDALHSYRHKWGATLGDYLRGPQQNLRFLLPLVYRNKMMTARMAEAILYGKSVVR